MTTKDYKGTKFSGQNSSSISDQLTVEEAIQIKINGSPYTVTMRTPGNMEELVRGLLYTEQIYQGEEAKLTVEKVNDQGAVLAVNVELDESDLGSGYLNDRSILSVSSCGICGKRELEDLSVSGKPIENNDQIAVELISKMFLRMEEHQKTFQSSGGSHASAAFNLNGDLLTVMEDIGRHNAVDKVIGSLILKRQLDTARFLLVSGRISYEIVTKCFMAGIPFLASVSAASSLAIEYAEQLGITLMAFCRGDNATVYTHEERVQF